MSTETALAFAPPEVRAAATAGPAPCDRISLRDHVVEAEIGAFQPERGRRQRLRVNIVVEVRPAGDAGDDVDRVLSYDTLVEAVAAELAGGRLNLLETLAERVAGRILAAPQALRAFVRIEKLDLGPYALGVEIVRSRAETPPPAAGAGPRPLVVLLDGAALQAADLPDRLAAWEAEAPLVLCVGPPDLPRPAAGDGPAQRRIDLLAIEQNAWVLAARDPRSTVVATRTELDWAVRQRRRVVWAPAKMVLDAADGPPSCAPLALALWLAGQLSARRLVVHGDVALPAGSRVPLVRG
jgi:dihydroneopterin aldolase